MGLFVICRGSVDDPRTPIGHHVHEIHSTEYQGQGGQVANGTYKIDQREITRKSVHSPQSTESPMSQEIIESDPHHSSTARDQKHVSS